MVVLPLDPRSHRRQAPSNAQDRVRSDTIDESSYDLDVCDVAGGHHRLTAHDTDTTKELFERVAVSSRLPHDVIRVWPSHAVVCLEPRHDRTLFEEGLSRYTRIWVELASPPQLCHVLHAARHLVNVVPAAGGQSEGVMEFASSGRALQDSARNVEVLLDEWQWGEF